MGAFPPYMNIKMLKYKIKIETKSKKKKKKHLMIVKSKIFLKILLSKPPRLSLSLMNLERMKMSYNWY